MPVSKIIVNVMIMSNMKNYYILIGTFVACFTFLNDSKASNEMSDYNFTAMASIFADALAEENISIAIVGVPDSRSTYEKAMEHSINSIHIVTLNVLNWGTSDTDCDYINVINVQGFTRDMRFIPFLPGSVWLLALRKIDAHNAHKYDWIEQTSGLELASGKNVYDLVWSMEHKMAGAVVKEGTIQLEFSAQDNFLTASFESDVVAQELKNLQAVYSLTKPCKHELDDQSIQRYLQLFKDDFTYLVGGSLMRSSKEVKSE